MRGARDAPEIGGERRRRAWPWVVFGIAMIVLPPAAWLIAHRLSSRSFPPAPWSASELPRIPRPRDNGLHDVLLSPSWTLSTVDDDLRELSAPLDGPRRPSDPRSAELPDVRWAEVVRRQERLHDWMSAGALRHRELVRVDAVLRAPRFADPCTGRLTEQCKVLELVNLADFAAVADLEVALRGEWSQAFERAIDLQLAAEVLIPTARRVVGNFAALMFALRAVDHTRFLLAGYRVETASGSVRTELTTLRPALEAYLAVLDAPDALTPDDLNSRRTLIAECHIARNRLMLMLANPAANRRLPGGFLAAYLVDPRATVATSDHEYVALMRWVEAPDHATRSPPPHEAHTSGLGWWVWNPGGKQLLDESGIPYPAVITRMDRMADRLFASRAALRSELAALLE